MAGRIKLHKLIKKIHLIASSILLSFMLVYAITGFFMINHDLFTMPEIEVSQSKILVEKPMQGDPKEYGNYLKKSLDLKGRINYSQQKNDNWQFNINHPAKNYQIILTPAQDTLHIRESSQQMTPYMVMHRIHILRGFKGGWAYTAWAVMYDTSCFAMIIFAITGIIMWYRKRKKFRHGWCFLLAGILIPVFFIYAFVLWK